MSRSIAGKIKINSFADIISGDDTVISEVPLEDLHDFKNHPFRVLDDEKMEETVESIKKYGILTPGIVRPRMDGGYEIIAGHRRKRACELAGLKTMPVVIRNYSDDEAVVAMVDTNLQREDILPSEKARAYRMKYEAMKHQGSREGGSTLEGIGAAAGESGKTVQRYISLSYLSEGLLKLVDVKKLPIRSGVELSYLKDSEQEWVEAVAAETGIQISPAQAEKIRGYSKEKELTKTLVREIISGNSPKPRKVAIRADTIDRYFDEKYTAEEIEETIIRLLEEWKNKGGE